MILLFSKAIMNSVKIRYKHLHDKKNFFRKICFTWWKQVRVALPWQGECGVRHSDAHLYADKVAKSRWIHTDFYPEMTEKLLIGTLNHRTKI